MKLKDACSFEEKLWPNCESESEVTQSCLTLWDSMTVAYQAPPSMGFSMQENWSGLPISSSRGIFLTQGSNLGLPHCRQTLYRLKHQGGLDSPLENRNITLPAKFHLVKAMVFPVVMCGCASWTIKKAELWRIDAFDLWCWRKLLRVPWTSRRSNQSVLKEISPEYSLEGLMLKLKLQYFGHLMRRTASLEKTLMLEKIEGRRRRGRQRVRWLDGITDSMNMSLRKLWNWWWTGKPGVLQSIGWQRVRHNWVSELTELTELTELKVILESLIISKWTYGGITFGTPNVRTECKNIQRKNKFDPPNTNLWKILK